MADELLELQRLTRSSIELKRSVKGEYGWDAKIYLESEEPSCVEAALLRLHYIDEALRDRYVEGPEKQQQVMERQLQASIQQAREKREIGG